MQMNMKLRKEMHFLILLGCFTCVFGYVSLQDRGMSDSPEEVVPC